MDTNNTRAPHTVMFTAANGIAVERYDARSWDEFHMLCQTMERLGWTRTGWLQRDVACPTSLPRDAYDC